MKPYEQGALDGLCAVYSIVNATRIVAGIGEEEAKELFKEIIRYLETKKDLGKILIEGIDLLTIGGILGEVVGDRIKNRSMPFKLSPETPLDQFWNEIGGRSSSGLADPCGITGLLSIRSRTSRSVSLTPTG